MRSPANETAFKELFAREYNKLCRYALSYMQDEHLAEDVVQETFIKFWEQKQDLVTSDNARFYLITAVRNNCISALRKQNHQAEFTDNTPEPEPELFLTERHHREVESEQAKRITRALNQLPPKCREVFLLVKLHGMSYKQAADTLNISVKTVENQMGKAIKIFRELSTVQAVILFLIILIKYIFTA